MSEEQTIYIGPEDDLTSVRERLESIQSRRVTLVIPNQTQLRSHVAWKLLHARARELSKDVLIVSSDPQIRSVAQAVKFKVAHSLESSPISRPVRPSTSRTGRSSAASRSKAGGRGGPEARGPRSSRTSNAASPSPARPQSQPLPSQAAKPSGQLPPQESIKKAESQPAQQEEAITGQLQEPFAPSIFDISEKEAPYDYRRNASLPPVTPTPAIQPLSPEQIDEEPDLLFEDFQQAQDIRRAAAGGTAKQATPPIEPPKESPPRKEPRPPHRSVLLPHAVDNPFAAMEDDSKPPLRPEQRGGVSLEGSDTTEQPTAVQDVSTLPTSILDHDIEDMGDQGAFDIFANDHPITRHDWEDEIKTDKPVKKAEPEREPSTRGSQSGTLKKTPRPTRPDLGNEDALPPVPERPTRIIPTTSKPLSRSGGLAQPPRPAASAGNRPAAPVAPASNRPGAPAAPASNRPQTRGRPGLSRPQQRPAKSARPAPQPSRAGRAAAARQRNIAAYISIFVIVLVLLFVGALAYFIPSAQVTVTLPSRNYTHDIALKVVPEDQLTRDQQATGTVVSGKVLTKAFTKSGTGTATGTARVNNQKAIGSVFFTNNGTALVTIPTGTTIATAGANGQLFVTTANAVVPPPGSNVGNTTEVPVEAKEPGPAGNVKSGTITVIPDDSLSQIAKASDSNMTAANLKLLVSNAAGTTGGGAGNATVVSRKDLDTVQKTLQDALQSDIDAWVKQQKAGPQDIAGKPQITSSLVKPPAEGTVETNGTFPAQMSATVTLMIIPNAALQDATLQQLNGLLAKDKNYTGYVVSHDARQPVQFQQMKQSGEGKALTLNFKAQASTIPDLTAKQVQTLVAGKQIPEATRQLKTLKDVQDVSIQTSPGFVPWVTSWTPNIHIVFVPGTAPKK